MLLDGRIRQLRRVATFPKHPLVLKDKRAVTAGEAASYAYRLVTLPTGILRRVEVIVTSAASTFGDTATADLDTCSLTELNDIATGDKAVHLLAQEPLVGRGVVAWQGEIHVDGKLQPTVIANFYNITAGDNLEIVAVVEVE
jgi:hypothetical protein